jgi:hypothetical protein
MMGRTRLCWVPAALLWLSGCSVLSPHSPNSDRGRSSCASELRQVCYQPPCPQRGIVFVLDGAGGFGVASRLIGKTIAEEKMPLEVRIFTWTHGYCRVLADEIHASHIQREARRLAESIRSCRQEAPERPVYIVAHSAGCCVALIAAENSAPNALERMVLLAPAVSFKRDLRGALRCSCQGIDAFISRDDWCCLGVGTMMMGTADRSWTPRAAGRIGFQPGASGLEDEALYAKLRQYPWDPGLKWTGHKGGHYGSYQPGFLRAFVLPLLQ